MERSDECFGFCFGIIFSNHFFGFLFNLKCLSRLWLSWAPPKADTVPSAGLGPPEPPQTSPRAGGPTLVPSSVGGSVPNSSISSSGTGTPALGEDFGGCEMGWAGIALQEEDQLGRKSLGRKWKEKKEFPGASQLPRTFSLSFLWDVAPPGSWICSQAHPAPLGGSWGIWVDFTSQLFLLQCQGSFLHPGMVFGPSQQGALEVPGLRAGMG